MAKSKKEAGALSVVLYSANLTEQGERRDAGSEMTVGEDISARRALDLLALGQIGNTEAAIDAGVDLQQALTDAAKFTADDLPAGPLPSEGLPLSDTRAEEVLTEQ
jgi:hypothetical protein